ncbi:MAG: hypothetical protein KGZ82_08630 [Bacteroidales bacterium]|nr:hypothetical protein [Bacteroidales bacterium]
MDRYFQSQPVFNTPIGSIDRQNGIISGITVARIGPARGHDAFLDRDFLIQLVQVANARPQGIKARFGHPNMCSTALGTYLGRFRNYAFHSDKVTADLYLDTTAKTTPSGNLFDYVIDMAANNPDMLGASIVFESSGFEIGEDPENNTSTRRYFRLKELRATDIVDDPAATDGMFSADSLPAQATGLLNENPQLAEFVFSKPNNVIEFLNTYLNTTDMNLSEKIKENFLKIFSNNTNGPSHVQDTELHDPLNENPDSFNQLSSILNEGFDTLFQRLKMQGLDRNDKGEYHFQKDDDCVILDLQAKASILVQAVESSFAELDKANLSITNLNARLAAKPSIPKEVTDPQVSVAQGNPDKDETGKHILQSLPVDLRRKLKNN